MTYPPGYPYRYMGIYKNIYLCITYIILLFNSIILPELTSIGSSKWLHTMYVPILTTIGIFILEIIYTSQYNGQKIQQYLSFYLIFPAVISFVLLRIKEYQYAYNVIKINITISIIYVSGIIIFFIAYLLSEFYEKYYSKQKIRCDHCEEVYSVRNKEKRNLEKYKYLSTDPECIIICEKCFHKCVKQEKVVLNTDYIKINPKAKQIMFITKTTTDGNTKIKEELEYEVNP